MSKKLTPKQKKFADNYIKTGNAYQSAVDAGYSKQYARARAAKMSVNVGIKSYIEERMKSIESDKIMDAKEALEFLTNVVRGAEKETKVVATQFSVSEVEVEADLKTKISATKEILKRYPDNDSLLKQQVRKLTAEADIISAKAAKLTNNSKDNDLLEAINDVVNGGNGSGETNI